MNKNKNKFIVYRNIMTGFMSLRYYSKFLIPILAKLYAYRKLLYFGKLCETALNSRFRKLLTLQLQF